MPDHADAVDVVGARRLDLRVLARDHYEHPVPCQDVVDELDRPLLADRQRRDRVREGDGLLERQDGQCVRDLGGALDLQLLNLLGTVLDDLDHASSGASVIGTCRGSGPDSAIGIWTRRIPSW